MNIQLSRAILLLAFCLTAGPPVRASSVIPLPTPEAVAVADAILRGTVVAQSCFKDARGLIHTRTAVRLDEPLKGSCPPVLLVVQRGGRLDHEDEFCGLSPRFVPGQEYLLFLTRGADGTLHCTQGHASALPLRRSAAESGEFIPQDASVLGQVRRVTLNGQLPGADVTDQAGPSEGPAADALTGMLQGLAARFLQPDRGEPIPYLIDAASLPAGITVNVATNAVREALDAWTTVTSLKFRFEGFQDFGQGADKVALDDQKLRIQLHDNYNSITAVNVLGIGGRRAITAVLTNTTWDLGGNVAGNEFSKSTRGYVVLESTNRALQSASTLAEVLCHEIGHALNLAHSSEVVTNDPALTNAMMYFKTHADDRGATLGVYDPPVIQQIYPFNTPPWVFNRVLDVTTASPAPNVPGINEIECRGFDLQTTNLTLMLTNLTANAGSFSQSGTRVRYTPSDFWGDTERLDPTPTGSFSAYDHFYARVSDGVNLSPYALCRVVSFSSDRYPTTSDGIPDRWMANYFGSPNPSAGPNRSANHDFDGDGLSNLNEYRSAMNPKSANSAQRITSFTLNSLQCQAQAYAVYEVLGSTNLTTWQRVTVFQPTNAPVEVLTNLPQTHIIATVSNLPTTHPQMFFRVVKVP